MNRMVPLMALSLIVLAGLVFLITPSKPPSPAASVSSDGEEAAGDTSIEPIAIFCAASNRAVMEAVREDYEAEFGVPVHVQYGPSNTLLSSAEVSGTGDLYLPADDSYLDIGRGRDLIDEVISIAAMQGVIVVPKDNPLKFDSFDDLLGESVRLVQANPDGAAIGKQTRQVLKSQELWDRLDAATTAYRTTVNDVANDVKVGAADAGIVYDAVLHTYPELEYVELPELSEVRADIAVGVLRSAKNPQRALHFARFLSAEDRGLKRYREFGFRAGKGDAWADHPEITLFAGSMLRPAIEDTVKLFEQREGVTVSRVYNGCGILVAQMKAGQTPDAYFACDSEFMLQVTDIFPEHEAVSKNELVIMVHKGNPKGIRSLKDLSKPGLRVGIGHEKQCAMGWLTQRTLKEGGVQTEVMENVTVQTPTGDMLVNQLRAGSLDAAVAYLSNAAGSGEFLDAIRIEGLDCSQATQPFAVAKESKHPQTVARLHSALLTAESKQRFLLEGFRWEPGTAITQ
ncbi:MAG: molybdate ABC transporter substrate-binding protein [Planctomycetota bacterium]|jgi:molybdenum ABC transporter molybdate-binding protein